MFIERSEHFNTANPVQLELDFYAKPQQDPALLRRRTRGQRAYLAGQAAEETVHRLYVRKGYEFVAKRWRGGGGEIDLIYRDAQGCIFVEVKQSCDFDRALQSLRPSQIRRLMQAASVFVADEPMGQLTDMRFDVALVNCRGETEILENALWAA